MDFQSTVEIVVVLLAPELQDSFQKSGVTLLKGAYPSAFVDELREKVYEQLASHNIHTCDPASWQAIEGRSLSRLLKNISRAIPGLKKLYTDEMRHVAELLLDTKDGIREMRPSFLLTPPNSLMGTNVECWHVPATLWHADSPRFPENKPLGLRMFLYLNDVRKHGGGTLMVLGSHKLGAEGRHLSSKRLKRKLNKHNYFRTLWNKGNHDADALIDQEVVVEGENVKLTEMTGDAGDLLLWDSRLLHNFSPNLSDHPRMLVQGTFMSEDLLSSTIQPKPQS